jgi:hypothetical protein
MVNVLIKSAGVEIDVPESNAIHPKLDRRLRACLIVGCS